MGTGDSVTERGCARLPTTTTCSSSCTDRAVSRVTFAPAPSATPRRASVWKPGSVKVTSYTPGGSPVSANAPAPSVTAASIGPPASVLRASTVTPGSTRPVASVTVPSMPASCAWTGPGAANPTSSVRSIVLDIHQEYAKFALLFTCQRYSPPPCGAAASFSAGAARTPGRTSPRRRRRP